MAVFGTVSVVMMARAASGAAVARQRGTAARPGEAVHRQPLADQAGRADGDVDRAESAERRRDQLGGRVRVLEPAGPVQALAPPEFSTTARTRPARSTCWHHSTGAALTRLLVKTPAAAACGPSLTTSVTSARPTT